jgi:hypothetical protein
MKHILHSEYVVVGKHLPHIGLELDRTKYALIIYDDEKDEVIRKTYKIIDR